MGGDALGAWVRTGGASGAGGTAAVHAYRPKIALNSNGAVTSSWS